MEGENSTKAGPAPATSAALSRSHPDNRYQPQPGDGRAARNFFRWYMFCYPRTHGKKFVLNMRVGRFIRSTGAEGKLL